MSQYRQGDVLLIECDAVPKDVKKHAGTVVATGEATGHRHRFEDEGAVALFDAPDGDMYAEVSADTALVHEEHGPIPVKPGVYRVRRQREYTPAEIRRVSD